MFYSTGYESNPAQEERYSQHSSYPSGISELDENGFIPAKTSFHSNEAPPNRTHWFDRAWSAHHGLMPTKWRALVAEKGRDLDEVEEGLRACPDGRDRHQVVDCLLGDLPDQVLESARHRFLSMDGNDVKRFNSHYGGVRGAVISACISTLEDSKEFPDDASDSVWFDEVLEPLCAELGTDPDGQIRLARKVWGGAENE